MPGVPAPRPAPPRRPGIVTGAATILLISGAFSLILGAVVLSGDRTLVMADRRFSSGGLGTGLLLGGTLEVVAGWLVLRLSRAGRVLGIVIAALGILVGLLQIGSSGAQGLLSMLLNGYVLYALLAYGFVFEQASVTR
jgi:hypothetical protein